MLWRPKPPHPSLGDRVLYKTDFIEGPIEGVVVSEFERHSDARGWLVELYRSDGAPEWFRPQMVYASITLPGVIRGPHEHSDQADYFCWFGPGDFKVTLWDNRPQSPTYLHRMELFMGEKRKGSMLVPKGVVHAYRCISGDPGLVLNCPDRLYRGKERKDPVDEIRHEDDPGNPFVIDELGRRGVVA